MIFDTHAHYDDEAFDEDREEVLASLSSYGICAAVDVGSTPASLDAISALTAAYPHLYGAYGLHPDEAGKYDSEIEAKLRRLLAGPKAVAVGEIGLDYHWDVESHETQEKVFRAQIDLALETGKPIMVHSRSAAEDTMRILSSVYGKGDIPEPGIIHCYAYSSEMAEAYVKMGFLIGIGGVATFQNSRKLKKVLQKVPLEHLVLETDSPYLAPEPHRGERNFSGYLPYVVRAVAKIRETTPEEIEEAAFRNTLKLFHLSQGSL